ncbi:AI-2E family transporter [Lactococcus taiwanensis]|uniref:AI-2E family transporter n=1 Tax=Lactococcus taiwanensis TaxID=1151742 RepID=A0AA45KES1_9LACT|nr:AI-2E family transporter [Lactococcus taiwanensis]KZK37222.1 transport and binding protein [Lactococcus cremoris]QRZ11619.1 AI-2E family transporter [Lactococcus taiwanensis]QSE75983.1 AI-2E family transporter [Lactococcus taiwanensis]
MEQEQHRTFKASWFFKWFINNKIVAGLAIILLFLLNIYLLNKVGFVFKPVGDFITVISLPVVLAAIFYYLLNPIVDMLEKRRVPRIATIIFLFVIIIALIVWGLVVAIPNIISGVEKFTAAMPHYVDVAQDQVNAIASNPHFEQFRPQVDQFANSIGDQLIGWSKSFSVSAVSSLTNLISKTTSVLISLIVFPFVLFYLLRDGKNLNGFVTGLLPNSWRKDTSKVLHEINSQLSNYVRGQVLVAIAVAVMFMIGLPIIGMRYAAALAITAGFLNLVPFLGSFLAAIPMIIVGLAIGGPFMLVKVLIVIVIEQTLEGRFISPLVLGKQLSIHPITILFVLLTAGQIFGIWGVLLGIPFYATVKVVVVHFYEWYREISVLYRDEGKQKIE